MALGITPVLNISNKNNNSIEYMHFYKNIIDDLPNPNICDLKEKLDKILEKYLYKYIESYPVDTPENPIY